jgi:hypothetical protein
MRRAAAALAVLLALAAATPCWALPTIADSTRGMEKRDGFLPLYWDAAKGRLLIEVARPDEEFLYLVSQVTGVGDLQVGLGLDRGVPGDESLARFERVGPRVLLVARNPRFRATSGGPDLARSVEESFPTSTLGSFEVLAEEQGRVLADATALFLSDAMDVRRQLREANQGTFALDRERSRLHLERTRAFPDNTEVEAALTFTSDQPGPRLRLHAPDARALTLRQHHSFVRLPDGGYRPRAFDPRIGLFAIAFFDFARPFDQDPVRRYAMRHRLQKKDPQAPLSEPVKPIVYYLDRAVPEPYRTAFKEGTRWWSRMLEQAGYKDALRVEDMPEGMDPMDARYHVIQWMHRTSGGSSVGPSFVDPRTGEIIKAAVRMDSHRSLANFDLYAALLPALGKDASALDAEAEALMMARRRQHAAHEVGHTLGFAHNFAAAFDERASVMAYPAPLIRLVDGRLDLSQAYAPGPGEYDALITRWAYTEFPPAQEQQGLQAIVSEMLAKGLRFTSNPDERAESSMAEASVWVNGRDAVEALGEAIKVQRFVVDRFDERAVAKGDPFWLLQRRFAAAYLYHRLTLVAAVKAIGGMDFRYALRGDPGEPTRLVEGARQRRALELVLDSIEPAALAVPERVLVLLAPRPFGYQEDEHALSVPGQTAFDQLGAARALASGALRLVLMPQRAARLAAFAARNPELPSLNEVVGRIVKRTWSPAPGAVPHAALRRVVQRVVVDELIELAAHKDATPEARAAAELGLREIAAAARVAVAGRGEDAHRTLVRADIERFLERRDAPPPRPVPPALPRPLPLGDECGYEPPAISFSSE